MSDTFAVPGGLIAMTSPGSIRVETAMALAGMMKLCMERQLPVTLQHFGGALVDKARNDAARACLQNGAGYVLYIDGDMVFTPEAVFAIVQTAFTKGKDFDIVGGYCVLRGGAVPTIDTGTGTWESHFPGSGMLEVIRTGAAFLLVKRHVFEKMPAPWFSTRQPNRWVDSFLEVDNFARTKMHGANPFRDLPGRPWEALLEAASKDSQTAQGVQYEIGEDSGFCDRAKLHGFRIAVDTDISIGHLDSIVLTGDTHKERMDQRAKEHRLLHGVLK